MDTDKDNSFSKSVCIGAPSVANPNCSTIVPISRVPIAVRPATLADIPFMDSLQKKYNKALGYFPTKQFEGYVESNGVLIAEEGLGCGVSGIGSEELNPKPDTPHPTPLGYIISRDRYLKRDELGVVYQLCVAPGTQRKLVGAALVREAFERSAYGCKLYCCWCAQDLDANYFWESLGFLPVAFRAGSGRKRRVHIFWQRRIIEGDEVTPYWYPFQTNGGAIKEDRLVFPIPPGVHWKEVMPVSLPREGNPKSEVRNPKQIQNLKQIGKRRSKIENTNQPRPGKVAILVGGRLKYIDRAGYVAPEPSPQASNALAIIPNGRNPASRELQMHRPKPAKTKACPERNRKIDPKYPAAARELRDRYLEQFNSGVLADGGPMLAGGKYEVARQIGAKAVAAKMLAA